MRDARTGNAALQQSGLAPGYTVYRRSWMAEEGVPANAELV